MTVPKGVIDAQLAHLQVFNVYFTRKEIAHLPEVIMPGEVIHAIVSGTHNGTTWLVAATTHRVLFLDKGMLFGLKQLDLPLDRIDGISHKTGLFFGEVSIATGGAAWKIEQITSKAAVRHFAEAVNALIQNMRMQRHAPAPMWAPPMPAQNWVPAPAPPAQSWSSEPPSQPWGTGVQSWPAPDSASVSAPAAQVEDDVVSRLERLAKLRDSGVLTHDEFLAQKAKILAG